MARPDTGTRQKLIETATDLIWTASYFSVSVDDICKTANVKKGSFYHYFPSKQDLAIAAMEEYYEQFIKPDMDRIFAASTPLTDKISAFADAIIEEQQETLIRYGRVCGCPLAALGSEMIGQEEQGIIKKVEEMFERCKAYVRGAAREACDAKLIAHRDIDKKTEEIHDFITGLMLMARIHNSVDGLVRDLKPGMFRILGLDKTENLLHKKELVPSGEY